MADTLDEKASQIGAIGAVENEFVRLSFAIEEGGALVEIFDKAAHVDLLEGQPIGFGNEGRVHFELDGDEDGVAWLGGVCADGEVSWCQKWSLGDDGFTCEWRVSNRTLHAVEVWPRFGLAPATEVRPTWFSTAKGTVQFVAEDDFIVAGEGGLSRYGQGFPLQPRQFDTWRLHFNVVGPVSPVLALSEDMLLYKSESGYALVSHRDVGAVSLQILKADGSTVAAPVELVAGVEVPFSAADVGGEIAEIAVVLNESIVLDTREAKPLPVTPLVAGLNYLREPSDSELARMMHSGPFRGYAHLKKMQGAFGVGEWATAYESAENALLYNGDDPLGWCDKALATVLLKDDLDGAATEDSETDDGNSLMNALFLMPFEPVVRAVGLFDQPVMEGAGANPLLKPLADYPPEMAAVATYLLELKLYRQAGQWLDECLRWVDAPRLHRLRAYGLLVGSRMRAEAVAAWSKAGNAAVGEIERAADEALRAEFG